MFTFGTLPVLGSALSSPNLSGISDVKRFTSGSGTFCTRPTSFIDDLVAIVPYVIMCATFSLPYFSVTQRNTSPRPSSSKSISISGKDIRSGFKKRSNSKSYFKGSISVIFKQYATTEPAAEPRPGPTDTPILRAAEIKSCTIKK